MVWNKVSERKFPKSNQVCLVHNGKEDEPEVTVAVFRRNFQGIKDKFWIGCQVVGWAKYWSEYTSPSNPTYDTLVAPGEVVFIPDFFKHEVDKEVVKEIVWNAFSFEILFESGLRMTVPHERECSDLFFVKREDAEKVLGLN